MSPVLISQKPDLIRAAGAVQVELREAISKWSTANPERIIASFPTSSLRSLQGLDDLACINVLGQLEGYVGATLPLDDPILPPGQQHETPIAWAYELHPMPISGYVQVLLRSHKLETKPLRTLADEIAHQVQNYAQKFTVDEVFSFTVSVCVIERVEKMSNAHKSNFRATLNRRLNSARLSIESGTLYSGLEIRRNANG